MRPPFTATQQIALRGLIADLLVSACLALVLFCVIGCQNRARETSRAILDAQTPGSATGAGATLTSPGNSATPTTQSATRRMAYYAPAAPQPVPVRVESPQPVKVGDSAPVILTTSPAPSTFTLQPAAPPVPAPAWIEEKTDTTIGQHQEAAGIMKAAATLDKWPAVKWLGLLAIIGGIGGLLWSAGHDQGYPLVCWKFVGAGAVLILLGDSPWSLAALIVPIGFYLAQKYHLARLFIP